MLTQEKVKWKYLTMFILLFTVALLGRFYYDIKHHERMLQHKINYLTQDIKKEFSAIENTLVDKYRHVQCHCCEYFSQMFLIIKHNNNN